MAPDYEPACGSAPGPALDEAILPGTLEVFQALTCTVQQAMERGQIRSDTDSDLVVDVLAAVVFHSNLFADSQFDVQRAVEVVDLMLRGIAVDFEELLVLSQQHEGEHRHGD